MISFVYLSVGVLRDIQVFKIGKTINLKQRTAALDMECTSYISCSDEIEALELEALLQAKTRGIGVSHVSGTKDWFRYSETMYQKVLSWFENDGDELIAQVADRVHVKREQRAKKAEMFTTIIGTATPRKVHSSSTRRYNPQRSAAQEMQTLINVQRAQITQLEQSTTALSKRRESYLLTIEVLQEEVRALRQALMGVEGRVREEVQKEHEIQIKQLQEQHEQEINALMMQIRELLKQLGEVS